MLKYEGDSYGRSKTKMVNNKQPYALVFGVSIFDIIGFTNNNYRCNDSNPGKVKTSFGGVCRNIAENMARVGVNTKFISILGDDETGRRMRNILKL
ncbi:pfkB carbohydrate kinase family protein [[Clostridium] sordellii ATCC 9714]|nr:pfkB carbohydrate kinase family protein [[Clostridium] sordellii ATCC 9714] [Paeniclostridium sordellii ATCC 9714]